MLAPRDAATDEEESDNDTATSSASTVSEPRVEAESARDSKREALQGHAVLLEDSPVVSVDNSPSSSDEPDASQNVENEPESAALEGNEAEVASENKPAQPFHVPMTGDFYMHDDRTVEAIAAATVSRPRQKYERGDGINATRWKHDKFEEHEREIEKQRPGRGRHEIPTRSGRWMKNSYPDRTGDPRDFLDGPPSFSDRGRGRSRTVARGSRGRGRGYSRRRGSFV